MTTASRAELIDLLEALCEERITTEGMSRLESLVLANPEAVRLYLDYMHLHGCLWWDAARGADAASSVPADCSPIERQNSFSEESPRRQTPSSFRRRSRTLRSPAVVASMAAALLVAVAWAGLSSPALNDAPAEIAAAKDPVKRPADAPVELPENLDSVPSHSGTPVSRDVRRASDDAARPLPPGEIVAAQPPMSAGSATAGAGVPSKIADPENRGAVVALEPLISFVDGQIRAGWETSEIQPSQRAEDSEWLRRISLDLTGRIPSEDRAEAFLKDAQPDKRARIVDELLDDPLYVRHWTTVWTNLLIGRSTAQSAERSGLQKFLREAIARNRPWNETVFELVSAEGTPEQNGAAGFLLAHLNNQAVPATAITARVFLGTQVQCTQCHNHPFNEWKQNQFWELNSFFQQTARVDEAKRDPKTGEMLRQASLVNRESGGPIFYETRSGLMRAAFPKFEGRQIDATPQVNRRKELAELIVEDENRQLARAFVNRMWEHFFGAAFTRPVDDMGPHNPPARPAVLERLAEEFVRSGYDVKQLARWICRTEAYQLSSRYGDRNATDDPSVGNAPQFSRVYVKSMTAEQLYDSLLVATRAEGSTRPLKLDLDRQRDQWIQQFVVDYETEENDEATTFDGTIPQALMMMNSELVSAALSNSAGTLLHDVVQDRSGEPEKIRRLTLAALSRNPTAKEVAALRKVLRERIARAPRTESRDVLLAEGLQDVFWALLNSNEFVLVH